MRPHLLALGTVGALATIIAGCGGGGGSKATPALSQAQPASNSTSAPNPNQQVLNTSGPTGKVSITLKIPPRKPVSATVHARLKAAYGHKHLRTLANTSPTATIRAVGAQQAVYAQAFEKRSGRQPQFVSGGTFWVELIMTDANNTILSDAVNECDNPQSGTCTTSFNAPAGSGLTASILLYDTCPYLLAAGAATGVNVTTGTNSPLTVTVNGVVSYLDVEAVPANQLVLDNHQSTQQGFNVTVQPLDADMQAIGAPGALLTPVFSTITAFSITPSATVNGNVGQTPSSLTPGGSMTAAPDANNLGTLPVQFTALGSDTQIAWNASTQDDGTSALPFQWFNPDGPNGEGANNPNGIFSTPQGNSSTLSVLPAIQFTNVSNFSPGNVPLWFTDCCNSYQSYTEYPLVATGFGLYGLVENLPGYAGNIAESNNGTDCATLHYSITAPPSPGPYSDVVANGGLSVNILPLGTVNDCTISATDDNGNVASLTFAVDSTSLTIQSKTRKH